MKKDTANFLRLMNGMNDDIAARNAEAKIASQVEIDPVRVEREAEKRERLGSLRARPRKKRRDGVVRNVFGFTDLSS